MEFTLPLIRVTWTLKLIKALLSSSSINIIISLHLNPTIPPEVDLKGTPTQPLIPQPKPPQSQIPQLTPVTHLPGLRPPPPIIRIIINIITTTKGEESTPPEPVGFLQATLTPAVTVTLKLPVFLRPRTRPFTRLELELRNTTAGQRRMDTVMVKVKVMVDGHIT
jgi:hypothetical protein